MVHTSFRFQENFKTIFFKNFTILMFFEIIKETNIWETEEMHLLNTHIKISYEVLVLQRKCKFNKVQKNLTLFHR